MSTSLQIPNTIHVLRDLSQTPYALGQACGELSNAISTLVSYHLDHASTYTSKAPIASISTQDLATAVDIQLLQFRNADGVTDALPNDLAVDRKQRRPRRRYLNKYTKALEAAFKHEIFEDLECVFLEWNEERTQKFNKGLDYGLTRMAWRAYPSVNAVLEAKGQDWGVWLRNKCEELGRTRVKEGKSAFDEF